MTHSTSKIKKDQLSLLLDIPERDTIFGFGQYAEVLTKVIVGTEPHFTIAIFGSWGSGKTTLLQKIQTNLKDKYDKDVFTVFFDAWRFQHEEHMILPLLNTIVANFSKSELNWSTFGKEFKEQAAIIGSGFTFKMPGIEYDVNKLIEKQKMANDNRSSYYNWLSNLREILSNLRKSNPFRRIVILIDDLDRCMPKKVIEILESIKVMLDVSGFVFVLALDESVIKEVVTKYYGETYKISSEDYIKKLIQVEFRLPPLRTADISNYIKKLQEIVNLSDKEISQSLFKVIPLIEIDNPREIKRFINGLLLITEVMKSSGVKCPVKYQVAFMAMEFKWSGIAKTVADIKLRKDILFYIDSLADHYDIALTPERLKRIKEILEEYSGLQKYLSDELGKELFSLKATDFSELVYYASITRLESIEEQILTAMNELSDRERRILMLRFGMEDGRERSLDEVGKEFNVSSDQIWQIETNALRKLRHPARSRKLATGLSQLSEINIPSRKLLSAIFGVKEKDLLEGQKE